LLSDETWAVANETEETLVTADTSWDGSAQFADSIRLPTFERDEADTISVSEMQGWLAFINGTQLSLAEWHAINLEAFMEPFRLSRSAIGEYSLIRQAVIAEQSLSYGLPAPLYSERSSMWEIVNPQVSIVSSSIPVLSWSINSEQPGTKPWDASPSGTFIITTRDLLSDKTYTYASGENKVNLTEATIGRAYRVSIEYVDMDWRQSQAVEATSFNLLIERSSMELTNVPYSAQLSDNNLEVIWNHPANMNGIEYWIEVKDSGNSVKKYRVRNPEAGVNSFNYPLEPGENKDVISFAIKAVQGGKIIYSEPFTRLSLVPGEESRIPTAPANFRASRVGALEIELAWIADLDEATSEIQYELQEQRNGVWVPLDKLTGVNKYPVTLEESDYPGEFNQLVEYRIRSVTADAVSEFSDISCYISDSFFCE